MSISSQLLILNETKNNIKTAINLKGVSVTNEPFAEYPDKIRQIPNGGGIYESTIIAYLEGTITHLDIPQGVTQIPTVFFHDRNLKNGISIPSSVTSIGDGAFSKSGIRQLVIPNTVTSIGSSAFRDCTVLTSITLPNGITTIEDNTFYDCVNLTDITIPDSVNSIGNSAFRMTDTGSANKGFLTVEIGSGLASIGNNAFYGCRRLQSITIDAINPPTIMSDTFINTNFTFLIYVPDDSVLAYQTAENWMTYADRIKGISEKPQ